MEESKEIWVERALRSVDGIQLAEAPPFLYTRIETRVKDPSIKYDTQISLPKVSLAFAVLLLLFAGNVYLIKQSVLASSGSSISSYGQLDTHYNIYDI